MIHTTTGVYNNDERKTNGVPSEGLANHIKYNITRRPGRAFFLDGVCIHTGYLSDERCLEWEKKLQAEEPQTRDTQPYH